MNLTKCKLTAELWYDRQPIRHAEVRIEHPRHRQEDLSEVSLSAWLDLGYQRRRAHAFYFVVRRPDGSLFDRELVNNWIYAFGCDPERRQMIMSRWPGSWPIDQAHHRLGFDYFRVHYYQCIPTERFEEVACDPAKRLTEDDRWWRRSA